jgi:hypothetical protein
MMELAESDVADRRLRQFALTPALSYLMGEGAMVLRRGEEPDASVCRRRVRRDSLAHRIGEGRGEGLSAAVETQLPPLRPEFARLEYSGRGDDAGDQFRRRDVKSRVPRPAGRIGHPHPGASPF